MVVIVEAMPPRQPKKSFTLEEKRNQTYPFRKDCFEQDL